MLHRHDACDIKNASLPTHVPCPPPSSPFRSPPDWPPSPPSAPTQRTHPEVSPVASTPARPPPAPRPQGCQPRRAPRRKPWDLLGLHCACARVCLRPCLCITKPRFGVQACPGLAPQRFSVQTCFQAPGSCPGASSLVVCALGWYLLHLRWVPCWLICAWCTGGTRCGFMCMWYLR